MITLGGLDALIDSDRRDVLSVLIDLDPAKVKRGATASAPAAWVRRTLREQLDEVPESDRTTVGKHADRVLERLSGRQLRARGVAFYAAPGLWHEFLLPIPLPNVVRYGRPDVIPLLWALEEYRPYGVLMVSRARARLLVSYLGRSSISEETRRTLNVREWRFRSGRSPTAARGTGTAAARGADQDTFEQRVDDHLRRFWVRAAEGAVEALRERDIDRIIIAGPDEAAHAVRALWPNGHAARIIGVAPMRSSANPAEVQQRTASIAAEDERQREQNLVERIMAHAGGNMGSVVGKEATLRALTGGLAMVVAAVPEVEGDAWRCMSCRFVGATQAPTCSLCGAPLETVTLRDIVPLLARRNGAPLELVGGEAAERLRGEGGVGAVLRYVPEA